jgi:hypothetical protein
MERIKQTNGRPPPPALNSGTVFLLHSLHLVLLVNCYQMAIFSYFPIDSRQSKISRVASLTKATEEAKERAAVAYQKAEEEKLERVRIEKAIIDELAQRDIKREQVEAISSAIKGKIGIIYLYPLSDPEASRYVFAISETLKRGGANPRLILSGTKELPVFPDKFNVAVSPIGVTVYESGGMHEVVDLLVRAFGEAGIKFQGQWSEKNGWKMPAYNRRLFLWGFDHHHSPNFRDMHRPQSWMNFSRTIHRLGAEVIAAFA